MTSIEQSFLLRALEGMTWRSTMANQHSRSPGQYLCVQKSLRALVWHSGSGLCWRTILHLGHNKLLLPCFKCILPSRTLKPLYRLFHSPGHHFNLIKMGLVLLMIFSKLPRSPSTPSMQTQWASWNMNQILASSIQKPLPPHLSKFLFTGLQPCGPRPPSLWPCQAFLCKLRRALPCQWLPHCHPSDLSSKAPPQTGLI